jgi:hypothetical protein
MEGIKMATKRKYKEAAAYEDTPEQVKHREERNALRRKLLKEGKVHKGDKKDVAHKVALDKGGSNKQGYTVQSQFQNRSFDRDSKGNLLTELSPKERSMARKKKK